MKFGLSILSITLLLSATTGCNDNQHGGNSSIATNTLDSSRIKILADNYDKGKNVFKRYCNECHAVPDSKTTDQYLFDNLFDRLPSPAEEYFVKYIRDSRVIKDSGDIYAKKVAETWNSDYEHNFKDSLSLPDFNNLIIYIKVAATQKYKSEK